MKKKKGKVAPNFSQNSSSDRTMQNMTLRDLQKACIVRGMPYEEMVSSSVLDLHSWFDANYKNTQRRENLDDFDSWRYEQMKAKYDPNNPEDSWRFHPQLRLGFIGEVDEEGNPINKKKPRLKGVDKPKKEKKERVEGTKVFKGTKKALTYELTRIAYAASKAKKGESKVKIDTKQDIIDKVVEQFPDANPSSVGIWYKRCWKELAGNS